MSGTLNVVAVSETTIFFLTCSVPHIEAYLSSGRVETERMDFYAKGGCKQ